jgi:chromosome partitioning protein
MSKKPELAIALLAENRSGKNKQIDLSQYDVIMFDAPPPRTRPHAEPCWQVTM